MLKNIVIDDLNYIKNKLNDENKNLLTLAFFAFLAKLIDAFRFISSFLSITDIHCANFK